MAVPDGAILRIVASLLFPESVIAQNVFYAVFTDTGGSDADQDVIDDVGIWVDAIMTTLAGNIYDGVSLDEVKVYIYDAGDDDWDELGDTTPIFVGASSADMLPHGVAAVVHAKTSNPDVQAAKYFGGFTESTQEDGILNGGALTALGLAADEWSEPFVGANSGGDIFPGVWSPTKTNFFYFNQVETINAILGYQRRRKPGVGI